MSVDLAALRRSYFVNMLLATASAVAGILAWRTMELPENPHPYLWQAATVCAECVALICTKKSTDAWRILRAIEGDADAPPVGESLAALGSSLRLSPESRLTLLRALYAIYYLLRDASLRLSAGLGGKWSVVVGGVIALVSWQNVIDALWPIAPLAFLFWGLCLAASALLLFEGGVRLIDSVRYPSSLRWAHGDARHAHEAEAQHAASGAGGGARVHAQNFPD